MEDNNTSVFDFIEGIYQENFGSLPEIIPTNEQIQHFMNSATEQTDGVFRNIAEIINDEFKTIACIL